MIDICLCVCVCWTYLSINFSIFFSVFLLARSVHLTLFRSSSFKLFKTENILCFVLFLCTAARRIRCTNDTNERRRQREVIVYLRYFHSKSSISPLDRSPVFTFATLWHSNWRMTVHSDGHMYPVCWWSTAMHLTNTNTLLIQTSIGFVRFFGCVPLKIAIAMQK